MELVNVRSGTEEQPFLTEESDHGAWKCEERKWRSTISDWRIGPSNKCVPTLDHCQTKFRNHARLYQLHGCCSLRWSARRSAVVDVIGQLFPLDAVLCSSTLRRGSHESDIKRQHIQTTTSANVIERNQRKLELVLLLFPTEPAKPNVKVHLCIFFPLSVHVIRDRKGGTEKITETFRVVQDERRRKESNFSSGMSDLPKKGREDF